MIKISSVTISNTSIVLDFKWSTAGIDSFHRSSVENRSKSGRGMVRHFIKPFYVDPLPFWTLGVVQIGYDGNLERFRMVILSRANLL